MFSTNKDQKQSLSFFDRLFGHWWMMFIEGILMIAVGIVIAAVPGFRTLTILIRLVGIERLIVGFFYLILSLRDPIAGILISGQALANLILGFFLALMPGFFLSIFIFLVAIWAFISGIGMIVQNRGPQRLTSRTVVGILLIAFGLFAGISPGHTANVLVLVFAVMIIVFGGYLLNRSTDMRKTEKKIAEDEKGYDDYTIE